MGYGKFGTDRHKPDGKWVQATSLAEVAGVAFRKRDAAAFGEAVRKAEARGLHYGLTIERQPGNVHDTNAIAIYGNAVVKKLFGAKAERWHIGFVPSEIAADVSPKLIDQGVPIHAELYSVFHGDGDYWEFKFLLLAPPGNSASKRLRDAARLS